jgi:hypothetical protein
MIKNNGAHMIDEDQKKSWELYHLAERVSELTNEEGMKFDECLEVMRSSKRKMRMAMEQGKTYQEAVDERADEARRRLKARRADEIKKANQPNDPA